MNILSFMKGADINGGVKEFRSTKGAMLIDVREPSEYSQGHIPGSINMPVGSIKTRAAEIKDKKTPIYVYCQSGGRAGSAANALKSLGFTSVKNIGGINSFKGQTEKAKGRSF